MIKKLLLRALRSDQNFAVSVWKAIGSPQVLRLNSKDAYILILDTELSREQEEAFVRALPSTLHISLIHGAKASLLHITDTRRKE